MLTIEIMLSNFLLFRHQMTLVTQCWLTLFYTVNICYYTHLIFNTYFGYMMHDSIGIVIGYAQYQTAYICYTFGRHCIVCNRHKTKYSFCSWASSESASQPVQCTVSKVIFHYFLTLLSFFNEAWSSRLH